MSDDGTTNPFDPARDADRHAIWQRLVAADFDAASFEGVRCFASANPDDRRIVGFVGSLPLHVAGRS